MYIRSFCTIVVTLNCFSQNVIIGVWCHLASIKILFVFIAVKREVCDLGLSIRSYVVLQVYFKC